MTLNELGRDLTSNIRVQKTIYDILRCVVFLLRTVPKSLYIIGRGAPMYVAVLCNVGSHTLNNSDLYWKSDTYSLLPQIDATSVHLVVVVAFIRKPEIPHVPRKCGKSRRRNYFMYIFSRSTSDWHYMRGARKSTECVLVVVRVGVTSSSHRPLTRSLVEE